MKRFAVPTMFESNIQNIYGHKGRAWLSELPGLVASIAAQFGLHDLRPVSNLSYNYVLQGIQGNTPIILKLSLDEESLKKEASALKCFARQGAVNVIAEGDGFLLLEQAMPGISLRSCFLSRKIDEIAIVCKVMKRLHQSSLPKNHNFPHISEWLCALYNDWDIPREYLQKARNLCDHLLKTRPLDVLLHGDLHHDNILKNGDDWVIIDPKGVVGEPLYDVSIFICNPAPELLMQGDATSIIQNRMVAFSQALHVPITRIADWCFVRSVLAWAWGLGDNCDTKYWEQITQIL